MVDIKILNKIKTKISCEITSNMTENEELYVSGMYDIYDILVEEYEKQLKVGKVYYVIVTDSINKRTKTIQEMILYKITYTDKKYYSFSEYINSPNRYGESPLTLSSEESIRKRVFTSKKEAEDSIRI